MLIIRYVSVLHQDLVIWLLTVDVLIGLTMMSSTWLQAGLVGVLSWWCDSWVPLCWQFHRLLVLMPGLNRSSFIIEHLVSITIRAWSSCGTVRLLGIIEDSYIGAKERLRSFLILLFLHRMQLTRIWFLYRYRCICFFESYVRLNKLNLSSKGSTCVLLLDAIALYIRLARHATLSVRLIAILLLNRGHLSQDLLQLVLPDGRGILRPILCLVMSVQMSVEDAFSDGRRPSVRGYYPPRILICDSRHEARFARRIDIGCVFTRVERRDTAVNRVLLSRLVGLVYEILILLR